MAKTVYQMEQAYINKWDLIEQNWSRCSLSILSVRGI